MGDAPGSSTSWPDPIDQLTAAAEEQMRLQEVMLQNALSAAESCDKLDALVDSTTGSAPGNHQALTYCLQAQDSAAKELQSCLTPLVTRLSSSQAPIGPLTALLIAIMKNGALPDSLRVAAIESAVGSRREALRSAALLIASLRATLFLESSPVLAETKRRIDRLSVNNNTLESSTLTLIKFLQSLQTAYATQATAGITQDQAVRLSAVKTILDSASRITVLQAHGIHEAPVIEVAVATEGSGL